MGVIFSHIPVPTDSFGFHSDRGTLTGSLNNVNDKDYSTYVKRSIGSIERMTWAIELRWDTPLTIEEITVKWTTDGDNSGGVPSNNSSVSLSYENGDTGFDVTIAAYERDNPNPITETYTGPWQHATAITVGLQACTYNGGTGFAQLWEVEAKANSPIRIGLPSSTIHVLEDSSSAVRFGDDSNAVMMLALCDIGDTLEVPVRFYDGSIVKCLSGVIEE